MDEAKQRWSTLNVVRITAIVLLMLVLMRFLWFARNIFLVTFLGVIFGLALGRAVDFVERFHIKRGIAATLIVALVLGALVGVGALVGPSLKRQLGQLTQKLPELLDQIEAKIGTDPVQLTKEALSGPGAEEKSAAKEAEKPPQQPPQKPGQPAQVAQQQQKAPAATPDTPQQPAPQKKSGGLRQNVGGQLQSISKMIFPFLSSTLSAIAGLIFLIFIAIYIASDPELYRRGVLSLFKPEKRERAAEVLSEVGDMLRAWLFARLIAMVVIGVVTGGALALIGVPAAGALGILAGLLEFIPLFGPIASAIPAMGMAMIEDPAKALWVAIIFIVIQQFEGNVLTPMLMQKRIEVPAAVVIVSVASLGVLFGVLGMLIAEPLSGVVILLFKKLWVRDSSSSESLVPRSSSE